MCSARRSAQTILQKTTLPVESARFEACDQHTLRTMAPLAMSGLSLKAVTAEFLATALFVFIGTGAATTFSSTQGPK